MVIGGSYENFYFFAFRSDGLRWHCVGHISVRKQKAKLCGKWLEFRRGTIFSKSHLPIWKILGFCHFWVEGVSLRTIGVELEMAPHSLVDWASFCREIVFDSFFLKPEKLGGPGLVVEIDESKFGRRKHHRGPPV